MQLRARASYPRGRAARRPPPKRVQPGATPGGGITTRSSMQPAVRFSPWQTGCEPRTGHSGECQKDYIFNLQVVGANPTACASCKRSSISRAAGSNVFQPTRRRIPWPILPCSRNPGSQPEKPGANPGWVIDSVKPLPLGVRAEECPAVAREVTSSTLV